jgi:hypothetical protein
MKHLSHMQHWQALEVLGCLMLDLPLPLHVLLPFAAVCSTCAVRWRLCSTKACCGSCGFSTLHT